MQKTKVCEIRRFKVRDPKRSMLTRCPSTSGAEQAGEIRVDLTSLKAHRDRYLQKRRNKDNKLYTFWEIHADLCLIIDGRNLRIEARSPENSEEVTSLKNFSIAASFVPGTA